MVFLSDLSHMHEFLCEFLLDDAEDGAEGGPDDNAEDGVDDGADGDADDGADGDVDDGANDSADGDDGCHLSRGLLGLWCLVEAASVRSRHQWWHHGERGSSRHYGHSAF